MTGARTRQVIALLVIAVIPAILAVWFRTRQATPFASLELIAYPLLFGSLGIGIVYAVKRWFLGESFADFNRDDGRLVTDVGAGVLLAALYFAWFYLARATLSHVLPPRPNLELLGLMLDMRESPLLVVLWFGPVLWVGIALFEESIRAFLLTGLWRFSGRPFWTATAIGLAAVLMGLVHWSQGPYGIVTIAVKSVLTGIFFLRLRRLLPLVVAHAFYDGLQVAMLLLTYPAD